MKKDDKGVKKVRRKSAMSKLLDLTTIVGGRPKGDRETGKLPFAIGIDFALTRAALSGKFKKEFLAGPADACLRHGIGLKDSEKKILSVIPPEEIERTIEGVFRPSTSKRRFMKSVAASVVAFVAGEAVWLYSGCGGATSEIPPDYTTDDGPPESPPISHDLWVTVGGMPSYLHVPASYASARSMPLLVAFHATDETCLEMMEKMIHLSDTNGFLALAVNWGGNPGDLESIDTVAIVDELIDTYEYRVDESSLFIAGDKEGGALAMTKGLYADGIWKGAAGFFGIPAETYRTRAPLRTSMRVYFCMASSQADYAQADPYRTSLAGYGLTVNMELIDGDPALTPELFSTGLLWLMQ